MAVATGVWVGALATVACPSAYAQQYHDALAAGDTARAIRHLRGLASTGMTPEQQCVLGKLLVAEAAVRRDDWRVRLEAQEMLDASLRARADPSCYLALARLKVLQRAHTEARRMLDRGRALIEGGRDGRTDDLAVEFYFQAALILQDWVGNFDYLVDGRDIPVSTPACIDLGFFCENFARPLHFNDRLAAAPSLADVASGDRARLSAILDSLLVIEPAHEGAVLLRLRRALVADDWVVFARVAHAAVRADSTFLLGWMAVLASRERRGDLESADRTLAVVDSLLGPDGRPGVFERIDVVARDVDPARAAEVWALSDPLHLTALNERRIQHYARLVLADVAFGDASGAWLGRDTHPGRLVLRYGWPRHLREIVRDGRRELDPQQMQAVFDLMGCAGMGGAGCVAGRLLNLPRGSATADGRWGFMTYDPRVPSFVFERTLSGREYRHKVFTMSQALDSAMARRLPSSYVSPYRDGRLTAMFTRFPRPAGPVVEIAASFDRGAQDWRGDRQVTVGTYVLSRTTGAVLNRAVGTSRNVDSVTFRGSVPVAWGPLSISVEGMARPDMAVAVVRRDVDLSRPETLAVSDILLADRMGASDVGDRREAFSIVASVDSLFLPGADLGLYWEIYNLVAADSLVRYGIELTVQDIAGGRPVTTEIARFLGGLVGAEGDDVSLTWERTRRGGGGGYVADGVVLRGPRRTGNYRITVEVTDRSSGATHQSSRVVTVGERPADQDP